MGISYLSRTCSEFRDWYPPTNVSLNCQLGSFKAKSTKLPPPGENRNSFRSIQNSLSSIFFRLIKFKQNNSCPKRTNPLILSWKNNTIERKKFIRTFVVPGSRRTSRQNSGNVEVATCSRSRLQTLSGDPLHGDSISFVRHKITPARKQKYINSK